MFGIGHLDLMPFIYAIFLVWGAISVWRKLTAGLIWIAIAELGFFALTFKMHGGTIPGSLASVIAAIAIGAYLKRWNTRRFSASKS